MSLKIRWRKERNRMANPSSQRQQLQTRNLLSFNIFRSISIPISRKLWRRKQRNKRRIASSERQQLQPNNMFPSNLLFLNLPLLLQTFSATQLSLPSTLCNQ